jgi:HD-GYP domain-containing protein (c-di-GMP phosphodiesterase class II)
MTNETIKGRRGLLVLSGIGLSGGGIIAGLLGLQEGLGVPAKLWPLAELVGIALLSAGLLHRSQSRGFAPPHTMSPATGISAPELRLVKVLASIIDSDDPFTAGRSYRVSHYAVRMGRKMKLRRREIDELEIAALLHDIGRTALRNDVFAKPGKLDPKEVATMSTHPQTGYYILKDVPGLEGAAELVRCHHEQPDGRGYPRGLTDGEIPLGSKIIMVAAAFDAMTSERPYRPGLPPEEAYVELQKHAGTMFAKDVVDAMIELHRSGDLFDGVDRSELELHSSLHGKPLAIEEFLSRTPGHDPNEPVVDPPRDLILDLPEGSKESKGRNGRAAA